MSFSLRQLLPCTNCGFQHPDQACFLPQVPRLPPLPVSFADKWRLLAEQREMDLMVEKITRGIEAARKENERWERELAMYGFIL